MGNNRVICIDGPRKGREYWWPEGAKEFQISTLIAGSVWTAYCTGMTSGYGGFIYKIYTMWGTGILVGMLDRIAYDGKVALVDGIYREVGR